MKKITLITGATTGTGYGVAQKFIKMSHNVCITSRDAKRAEQAAEELKAFGDNQVEVFGFGLEALQENQVISVFDILKERGYLVDKLILVAANMGLNMPNFFEVPYEDWIRVIDTNIGWNFMISRQAAKHMVALGGGAIVVVGSVNGIRTTKNRSAYCTSKTGLHGLARNLAVELGSYHIRVNTVVSGGIKTDRYYARPEIQNSVHNKTPYGDIAEFSDIANAAYFLADDSSARIITGAELAVDGGALAQFVYEEEGIRLPDGITFAD
ncbi:SDR family oxidoreductase [Chakrabartyella piscis]|uniref:SDR family NAD(P)-dependent oxidoreductase n=1 Tax=Chakrabartyella piscis TaxID=2918914 RepID=UPI00295893E3|nr:SDR family oxidoreductase [Chakrabartyella piscis]